MTKIFYETRNSLYQEINNGEPELITVLPNVSSQGLGSVSGITFSPSGELFVLRTIGKNNSIDRVNLISGEIDHFTADAPINVSSIAFDSNGTLFASLRGSPSFSGENRIVTLDPDTGAILSTVATGTPTERDLTFIGTDGYILEANLDSSTEAIISKLGDPSTSFRIGNAEAFGPRGILTGEDGQLYVTYDSGLAVKVDPVTGQSVETTVNDPDIAGSMATTSDSFGTGPTPPPGGLPKFGTPENDVLFGGPRADVLIGLEGDDALISFEQDDVLIGREGADSLDSGSGNDSLFGESGNDQLFGGSGDDALFGGTGNDFLVGDAQGTSGNDGLFGGEGADIAFGGLGDDFIEGNDGSDVLYGETGNDWIFGGQGSDLIFGGTDSDTLIGETGDDTIFGENEDDFLAGNEGNDSLDGGYGNDFLEGDAGNDLLFGAQGNDVLFGGEGNDFLAGGAGNDFVVAGTGVDVIAGGTGADTIKLEAGSGQNFWSDFENGLDRIDVSANVTASQFSGAVNVAATADGTSTFIGFQDSFLILEGVDAAFIDIEDFFVASEEGALG